MIVRVLAAVLFSTALAVTSPAATTRPSTGPATRASTFPAPAELLQRIKQAQEEKEKRLKVAYMDLTRPIGEKPADFSLFGDAAGMTLHTLVDRLRQARDDKDLRGVLITLSGGDFSLAQAQEIRDALREVRKAGKQVFVYADAYDTASYTLASGASGICMLGAGEIELPGVGVEALFAKGLLDKVGVTAEYIQIGPYKGAEEPFTRSTATPELRGELSKLVDSLYEQIVDGISANRNLSRDQVRQLIDEAIIDGATARQRGLVDHLVDLDGLRALITSQLGGEIDLIQDYGRPPHEEVDLSNPFGLFALLARRPERSDKPAVALMYIDGVIMDGNGGDSLLDAGTGSEDLRRAFRTAVRDENVKAIVLRIDSPGGSALASEAIWQAARHAAARKPLIISIGGMAASGGYYVASAGDCIFADPAAIVGSIGVVGGKFVLKGLYEKIGLTSETFSRGDNADLFSSTQPFSDRQRQVLTTHMRRTYDLFVQRVLTTRKDKIRDIEQVAQGRIFVASRARQLGMVDEIGGLNSAIQYAAGKAGLKPGDFGVRIVPAPKTLADLLGGGRDEQTRLPFAPRVEGLDSAVLRSLSPLARHALLQEMQLLRLLQARPAILAMPYVLTIR